MRPTYFPVLAVFVLALLPVLFGACRPGVSSGIVGGGGLGGGFDPVGDDDTSGGDDDDTSGDDDDDTSGDDDDTGGGDDDTGDDDDHGDDDSSSGDDDDDDSGSGDDDDTGGGGGDDDDTISDTGLLLVTVDSTAFGVAPLTPTTTLEEVIYLENAGGNAISYAMTLTDAAGGTFLLETDDVGCGASILQPGFGSSCTIQFTPYQAIAYSTDLEIDWEETAQPGVSGLEVLTFTGSGAGVPETDCDDGVDDNGDSLVDCDDPTCDQSPVCNPGVDVCCLGWEGSVDPVDASQCDETTPATEICNATGTDGMGNPILGNCSGTPLYDAFCCGVGWDATCAANYAACGASCPSR